MDLTMDHNMDDIMPKEKKTHQNAARIRWTRRSRRRCRRFAKKPLPKPGGIFQRQNEYWSW